MNFFSMMNIRFGKEEISNWGSLKKSGYILLPLLIYILFHDLAEILLWAGLNQIMVSGGESVTTFLQRNAYTVQGIINGLMILIGVLAIHGAVKSEVKGAERQGKTPEKEQSKKSQSEDNVQKVTDYMLLAALAFTAAFGLNLIFDLFGITESSQTYTETAAVQYGVDFLVGLLLYGIVSPVAEEAVFRGVMYNRMKRCFGYLPALILSALLFGCYHGNLVQALYGTILGMLIAYTYEKYESFAAPVLFHAVANVSVFVLTYHSSFAKISTGTEIVMAVVLTIAAVICFICVRKKKK